MCSWHFGPEDWGADIDNLLPLELVCDRTPEGRVAAYVAFKEEADCIRGMRSGVLKDYRRQGLARRLYVRMRALARRRGKAYRTYCSAHNYSSLNAHLKAGMLITKTWYENGYAFVDLEVR
jgi:GNAT superfamily N-acetyltransferase